MVCGRCDIMKPSFACAPRILSIDPEQAVTTIVVVENRRPGRVWIELERDRCRKTVSR